MLGKTERGVVQVVQVAIMDDAATRPVWNKETPRSGESSLESDQTISFYRSKQINNGEEREKDCTHPPNLLLLILSYLPLALHFTLTITLVTSL